MKIIKQGLAVSERLYVQECPHCQSVFTFTKDEVEHTYDQRDGSYYLFTCPYERCNMSFTVTNLKSYRTEVDPY